MMYLLERGVRSWGVDGCLLLRVPPLELATAPPLWIWDSGLPEQLDECSSAELRKFCYHWYDGYQVGSPLPPTIHLYLLQLPSPLWSSTSVSFHPQKFSLWNLQQLTKHECVEWQPHLCYQIPVTSSLLSRCFERFKALIEWFGHLSVSLMSFASMSQTNNVDHFQCFVHSAACHQGSFILTSAPYAWTGLQVLWTLQYWAPSHGHSFYCMAIGGPFSSSAFARLQWWHGTTWSS